jgi:molecular chaperone GrpE
MVNPNIENEQKEEAKLTEAQAQESEEEASEIEAAVLEEPGEDPLEEARKEAEDYKDRFLRLAAEFENYKKRKNKEFEALVQSASERVIRDLLPVLDAVDRALVHSEDGRADSEGYREGVKMIMEQLPRVLHNRGLLEIEAVGRAFDPHYHEALMQVDSDEHDAGMVAEVVEKGYCLRDKVIRHARVVVSRGRPEEVGEPAQKARKEED